MDAAAMSDTGTESVPLSPDAQLCMLFPLPEPAVVQAPAPAFAHNPTSSSGLGGCLTYPQTVYAGNASERPRSQSGTAATAPAAPRRAASTANTSTSSTTPHNAFPVLPIASTRSAAPLRAHASQPALEPRRAHQPAKLRRTQTDPPPCHSHTGAEKPRRRRTESRDLHPRQDDRASVSASRSRQRPLFVPSNATATPYLAVIPLPDVGPVDIIRPVPENEQLYTYRYPTPPASPLLIPGPPTGQASLPPPRENRGQMVWPGIYFST